MKHLFRVFSAIMLFMVSCEKNTTQFGVVSDRLIRPIVSAGAITKATTSGIQDVSNLKSDGFKMEIIADVAYNKGTSPAGKYGETRDVKWNNTTETWDISETAYWINDTKMSFWAYNNAVETDCDITNITANASNIAFTYPKSAVIPDGQTDLLFAYRTKSHNGSDSHASGSNGDTISIKFKHAMSRIDFKKGTFTGVDGYEIGEIRLIDIKSSGSATFNKKTFAWSSLSGNTSFAVASPEESFIVIPQNTAGSSVQVTLTKASSPDIVLSTSLPNYDMKPGQIYTYNITVNAGSALNLSLSVANWEYYDRDLEIKEKNVTGYLNKDNYAGGVLHEAEGLIFIHNAMPVTGSFQLSSPKGAKLLLALDGNLDAFEVSPKICYIDDNPVNFTITPKVHDPKIDYQTRLHIYLVGSDGSVSELDEQVMKEEGVYKHYTIILPAQ